MLDHFSETDRGDFTEWVDGLIEAVKAGKMVLGFFGGIPWFFEDIKDKCLSFPFHPTLRSLDPTLIW